MFSNEKVYLYKSAHFNLMVFILEDNVKSFMVPKYTNLY